MGRFRDIRGMDAESLVEKRMKETIIAAPVEKLFRNTGGKFLAATEAS